MPVPPDTELGDILLARARHAIERELGLDPEPAPAHPHLTERGATFVTLKCNGELRGCIGSVRRQRPLGEDLAVNAVGAALRDPRFPPVTRDELSSIRIEVSLLSEPEFLEFTDEDDLLRQLRPGVHGVLLFAGCLNATFLPQVWEQLPEPRSFLAALKQKAGLSPDRPARNLMAAIYTVQKWLEPDSSGRARRAASSR
jgi:AmmeMemoRadiSam system protein A